MRKSPVSYSDAIADHICEDMARGRHLQDICKEPGMPSRRAVTRWARDNINGFGARYHSRPHPRGVPSRYTRALTDNICDGLREGWPLKHILAVPGMPSHDAVMDWVNKDRDGFRGRYAQARELGYLAIADEIIAIADDPCLDVARARLMIATRCWLLAKMLPRLFGNRVSLDVTHEAGDSLRAVMEEIAGRTRGLLAGDIATADAAKHRPSDASILRSE